MKKLNVVIADSNDILLLNAKSFFTEDNEINLITTSNIYTIKTFDEIDMLVLDINLTGSSRYDVEFSSELKRKPSIIAVAENKDDEVFNKVLSLGADLIMFKPFNMENLRTKILALRNKNFASYTLKKETKNLDERLSNIFIRAGIPPHIKGYQFLREAVKLSVDRPEMINNITKKLYPSVASQFDTTASKVERAIRHAIEVAWNRGKIENINGIFGIKIYNKGEKPTNGELIALIADKIMIECM